MPHASRNTSRDLCLLIHIFLHPNFCSLYQFRSMGVLSVFLCTAHCPVERSGLLVTSEPQDEASVYPPSFILPLPLPFAHSTGPTSFMDFVIKHQHCSPLLCFICEPSALADACLMSHIAAHGKLFRRRFAATNNTAPAFFFTQCAVYCESNKSFCCR